MIALLVCVALFQDPASKDAKADAKPPLLSADDVLHAGKVAGFTWTPEQLAQMQQTVLDDFGTAQKLWQFHIDNDVSPAFTFDPLLPGMKVEAPRLVLVGDE